MSAGSRGGRRAALPAAGWEPPSRFADDENTGTRVRFTEELSGRVLLFDFGKLAAGPAIQQWLARAFVRSTGPRSGAKRAATAEGHYWPLKLFADCLGSMSPGVQAPGELNARHIAAFRARYDGRPGQRGILKRLRVVLHGDPELPEAARVELFETRLPDAAPAANPVTAYSAGDWQVIMTALRHDVRGARDRIRAGRKLLERYRAGEIPAADPDFELGQVLDEFDRTGDFPRFSNGAPGRAARRCGGMRAVALHLCMTQMEMTAFCLLLTALTGENAGTVTEWPAVHYRPGGTGEPGTVLVEESKPRRGPELEHLVAALEDAGPGMAGLLGAGSDDHRLLRSPVRVYLLLLELSELARRHAGTGKALTAFKSTRYSSGGRWTSAPDIHRWAAARGFPVPDQVKPGSRPAVSTRRIRQTVIEQRRSPIAQTRQTMNDHYLARSRDVQAESRTVVGTALRGQVEAARSRQKIPVLTAEFLARAEKDIRAAAAEAGMEPDALAALAAGEHDTALAACTDHRASPHAPAGVPCPASFMSCLDCPNARALPSHLPVQIEVADRMTALRANIDPSAWRARYEPRLGQLADIIGEYTKAEQEQARRNLDDRQRRLVDDLMDGKLDLR